MLITFSVCLLSVSLASAADSCFEPGRGYAGNDIKQVIESSTPEDCQYQCQMTAGCVVWTHDTRNRDRNILDSYENRGCWLHSGKGPRTANGDFVSGPQYCPTTESCYDTETDYYGNDIEKLRGDITTAQKCQTKCQSVSECNFWTWYSDSSSEAYGCHLKDTKATPASLQYGTSGPKDCPAPPTPATTTPAPTTPAPEESCFEPGRGYAGNDIKQVVESSTPEDCQKKCQMTAGCVVWTHDTRNRDRNIPDSYENRGCWLHSGKGPRTANGDFVSGPQYCPAPPTAALECTTGTGTDYAGKVSTTSTGKTCQRWDTKSPHSHSYSTWTDRYPESSVAEASNYCRNPSRYSKGLWCYTTDASQRWELCDVPKCSATPAPTTAATTTVSPTTSAPTTAAPTAAPTTTDPTTVAPTTAAPTTAAPTTTDPTTVAPTTAAPTTAAPTTASPTTLAPTTEAPTTFMPIEESTTEYISYVDMGCWRNKVPQKLDNLERTDKRLDKWNYKKRADAINKCFTVAADEGYDFFGVGNKGQCWAGYGDIYQTYGQPRSCPSSGKGKHGMVNVYMINKSLRADAGTTPGSLVGR